MYHSQMLAAATSMLVTLFSTLLPFIMIRDGHDTGEGTIRWEQVQALDDDD